MNVGVMLPQTEIGPDPTAIRDFVQAAEALGYAHLSVYEEVLGADAQHPRNSTKLSTPKTCSTSPLCSSDSWQALPQIWSW